MNGLYNGLSLARLACIAATVASLEMATQMAAQTNAGPDRVTVGKISRLKATVVDVDHEKREIVLQGPHGHKDRFEIGAGVKNFDQINKGDKINIQYHESIAFALVKPGQESSGPSAAAGVIRRPDEPGGAAVAVTSTTATIEDVNRDKRQVTLKDANGESVEVYVDPSVGNLKNIKKGDQISLTYTKALAISVETPMSATGRSNQPAE